MTNAFGVFSVVHVINGDIYIYIYDLVPKGAHARGYALQLKIKHCRIIFFNLKCCVVYLHECMNI